MRQEVTDLDSYKGWVHPWWPPHKSTNMADHVDLDNFVIFDTKDCKSDGMKHNERRVELFLMLNSNPDEGGERSRNDNRQTWMKFLKDFPSVKVNFVIGLPKNALQQEELWKEQHKHCDMIQFNFVDTYFNSTVKMAHSVEYFYRYPWDENSGPPEFMLKGDDDIYVNIKKMIEVLDPFLKQSRYK